MALGKLVRQIGWGRMILSAALLVIAVLIARTSWHVPLLIDAEHALFDARMVVAAPLVGQDDRIVLVTYTDETLINTGKRSPLDRTTLAKALKRIDAMGARAIGIDILIDQPQDDDKLLIDTFRQMKTPTFLAHASTDMASDKILFRQQQFLESFQKAIATSNVHPASIVIQTDSDNVMRRWPDVVPGAPPRMPNALYPEAKAFAHYQGSVALRRPAVADTPVFAAIPIDTFANDAIFAAPGAAELFAQQIRGKFVLIGGNIEDIDLFQTPLSRIALKDEGRSTWGMELFAQMLAQMLDNRLLRPLPSGQLWVIAVLVVLAGGLTAGINRRPLAAGAIIVVQLALIVALPFWLALRDVETYDLPAFGWLLGWFTGFVVVGAAARALSSEQRHFAQGALGKYLPRDIASEIIKNPESLQLRGEKREIFVLFSDLEGFTKLSHAVEPEMVAFLLNRYLDALSEVVLEYGGTIDKFVGDAVVAFWGAPISRPDDGQRCVQAAIAINRAGEEFRANAPEGVPPIGKTRVGVHFGEAIVGNFGGEGRIQYTALGDSMNTAARLESANKQTKTSVLISDTVVERCGLDIFRSLGKVVLRGRGSAIEIFEPVPEMAEEKRKEFAALSKGATRGDAAAIAAIVALSEQDPDDAALANFAYRLQNQTAGGHYVLD